MDPLKQIVKNAVLPLLQAGKLKEAEETFARLTEKALNRRDLDLWFDREVRFYIVARLIKQNQHEEVMRLYTSQKMRVSEEDLPAFEQDWQKYLNTPSINQAEAPMQIFRLLRQNKFPEAYSLYNEFLPLQADKLYWERWWQAEVEHAKRFRTIKRVLIAIPTVFAFLLIGALLSDQFAKAATTAMAAIATIIILISFIISARMNKRANSKMENDPIRSEYERRKRARENR